MDISTKQYKRALLKSGVVRNPKYLAILNVQYNAPRKKITATQLADILGAKRWSVINLRYGEIGHKLSDQMEVRPPRGQNGKYWWWNILSEGKQTREGFVWTFWPNLAAALEELEVVNCDEVVLPEELHEPERYSEGAKSQVVVNKYERNAVARELCIQHYGARCAVCGFDFEKFYGEIGEGYIHVHHLVEVSEIGAKYEVDPVIDLRPVCPNCHAMLHQKRPALSIEDLRKKIAQPRH